MAGRGRGMTLPAWMTASAGGSATDLKANDSASGSAPTTISSQSTVFAASTASDKFADAPAAATASTISTQPFGIAPGIASIQPQQFQPRPMMPGQMPFGQIPPQYNNQMPGQYAAPMVGQYPSQFPMSFQPRPMFQPPQQMMGGGGPVGMPGRGMMPGMPLGLARGLPAPGSIPLAGAYGAGNPGMMPRGPAGLSSQVSDPNNDVLNWSEHIAPGDDGRKYWYNKVTNESTFDKPFILKTPEERSIPPCKWKEYSADGKKYYSDGKESLWEMPEEYRIWKEKIEAIERKKLAAVATAASSGNGAGSSSSATATASGEDGGVSTSQGSIGQRRKQQQIQAAADAANAPPLVFATKEEAKEAFMSLLFDLKISTTAKTKEVKDTCEDDPRWMALKSAGERNQALAEYQTKRLKQEKEAKQAKAKRCRDSYLVMLAENTDIDARTRWSDAMGLLKDDNRFKNIEDAREREDLFNDFIGELLKKEREDRNRSKDTAIKFVQNKIADLVTAGSITRKSIWVDCKDVLMGALREQSSVWKSTLEEVDIKRAVQDIVVSLEAKYKDQERRRREEWLAHAQKQLDTSLAELKLSLEELTAKGVLKLSARWREASGMVEVATLKSLQEVTAVLESATSSEAPAGAAASLIGHPRDVFEKVIESAKLLYKGDRRTVRDALDELKLPIEHDSTYASIRAILLKFTGLLEVLPEAASSVPVFCVLDGAVVVQETALPQSLLQLASSAYGGGPEDGEEPDGGLFVNRNNGTESKGKSAASSQPPISSAQQLKNMLKKRPHNLRPIFEDLLELSIQEYEEERKRVLRREGRFIELLEEYFYRSDHINIPWEDAKRLLERHSVYDTISKSDKKRIFGAYMEDLQRKMDTKKKSIQSMLNFQQQQQQQQHGGGLPRDIVGRGYIEGSNLQPHDLQRPPVVYPAPALSHDRSQSQSQSQNVAASAAGFKRSSSRSGSHSRSNSDSGSDNSDSGDDNSSDNSVEDKGEDGEEREEEEEDSLEIEVGEASEEDGDSKTKTRKSHRSDESKKGDKEKDKDKDKDKDRKDKDRHKDKDKTKKSKKSSKHKKEKSKHKKHKRDRDGEEHRDGKPEKKRRH